MEKSTENKCNAEMLEISFIIIKNKICITKLH